MTDVVTIELPPRFYMNQSRWKAYADCDRLYGWAEIEKLEPSRPRRPLILGTAVHRAQVEIHRAGNTPEAIASATEGAAKFYEEKMKEGGSNFMDDEEVTAKGAEMLRSVLPAYHKYWKDMGQVWKPLGQELSFKVEVGEGTNVFLVGTIDNLVTFMNALWLVDYKTMGKYDKRNFLQYEIDVQLTAYIYGGTKQLSIDALAQGKKPVIIRGAIIDGIIKAAEPRASKSVIPLKPIEGEARFHRELYTRSIDDLRDFEQEFCMKAWEIASKHAIVAKDRTSYNLFRDKMFDLGGTNWKVAFPKNTQQCFRYGTCAFRDLCVKDTPIQRMTYRSKLPDYVDVAAGRAKEALNK